MTTNRYKVISGIYEGRECYVEHEYAGFADVILTNKSGWVFPERATVKRSDLERINPLDKMPEALL